MSFERLGALVQRASGLQLVQAQLPVVERFLEQRREARGAPTVAAYLDELERDGGEELQRILNLVTNGLTYFYREPDQLEGVRALMQRFRSREDRPIALWCAGCSTGEEPYTVSLIASELGLPLECLATDVNTDVLDIARRGRYRPWGLRALDEDRVQRHFVGRDGEFEVRADLRGQVRFQRHNLLSPAYPRPEAAAAWDLILCRNVLIYFDRATQARVVDGFARKLDRRGHLFLGVSESLQALDTTFELAVLGDAFYYHPRSGSGRRPQGAERPAPPVPPAADRKPVSRAFQSSQWRTILERLQEGDLRDGEVRLRDYLRRHRDHAAAWVTLGNLALEGRRQREALEHYDQAVQVDPLDPEVHFATGHAFRRIGDTDRAARSLRQALFLDDRNWVASFQLASLLRQTGRRAEARSEYAETLRRIESSGALQPLRHAHFPGLEDITGLRRSVELACRREVERSGR